MKKIISLALAASMVAAMSVTSFAATPAQKFIPAQEGTAPTWTSLGGYSSGSIGAQLGTTDGNIETLIKVDSKNVVYGYNATYIDDSNSIYQDLEYTALAVPLHYTGAAKDMKKDAQKTKVKVEWLSGTGKKVESVKIEYLKNNMGTYKGAFESASPLSTSPDDFSDDEYGYYLVIRFNEDISTSTFDATGIVTIYTASPNTGDKYKLNFTRFRTGGTLSVNAAGDNSTIAINDPNTMRSFSQGVGENVLVFEGVGEFHSNFEDQNRLYLAFNFDENETLYPQFSDIDHEYINFPAKPKFYRTGLFYLYAEKDQFPYVVNGDVVTPIDAVYDEEYDAYRFPLRNFPDSFILADNELPLPTVDEEPDAPTDEEPIKDVPNTGR